MMAGKLATYQHPTGIRFESTSERIQMPSADSLR